MFRYARPRTIDQALDELEGGGEAARVVSGGTDLLVGLRKGKLRADLVVDVKGVAELAPDIREEERTVAVSANVVMTDIVEDERIRKMFPALVEAASAVGSIQIRNRATLAGNLCNASPAADTAPPLLIYRARVEIAGRQGRRQLPLTEFLLGPGQTALRRGELVTAVVLPVPDRPTGSAFARLTRRRGVDLATVSVCCGVEEGGPARLALGAAGPRPFVVTDDTGALADPSTDEGHRREILTRLLSVATPISDVRGSEEYRLAMLVVLAERTLETALSRRENAR